MKFNTARPFFDPVDIQTILAEFKLILEGEGLLSMGKHVQQFEKEFAAWVGTKHAVATSSCTGALETLLSSAGIGPGDEVIVPAQTFIATASAPVRLGATPIFCEIDQNFLLDIQDALSKITAKTKAVILVHFAGLIHPQIFDLYRELKQRGIFLFEDAAHAHGAHKSGVRAGALADAACFSFYSTKNMTTGEGGMITTSDSGIAERCQSIRARGLDTSAEKEIFSRLGTNQRMTEVAGLMGLAQLGRVDDYVDHRNRIAQVYTDTLRLVIDQGDLHVLPAPDDSRHSYWRFIVVLDNLQSRERIAASLVTDSIQIDWPYHPLVHLQPIMRHMFVTKPGSLPFSESFASKHFCLPIHRNISEEDAKFIASRLVEALR